MPRTQSARKAFRQSVRRRAKNIARADALKTAVKEYKKFISASKFDEAKTYLPQVYKRLDTSAKVHLIKAGKSARLKSRLTKLLTRSSQKSS